MSSRPSLSRQGYTTCRWDTIRYAIDNNARTARLCLILLVVGIVSIAISLAGLHVFLTWW